MPSSLRIILSCACLLLAACNSDGDSGNDEGDGSVRAADLCVSSACGTATKLLDIPGGESLLFGADGRLFVSGSEQVYEIRRDGEQFSATPLAEPACAFHGLAIRGTVLYASCASGALYAGRLDAQPMLLQPIFQMTGMCIANGTALGADGNLYVVDEPLGATPGSCLPPDPKILRLKIDPADPLHVLSQETWLQGSALGQLHLGLDTTLRFPNGLASEGSRFYASDGGSVFSVDLQADGSPGPVTPLFFEPTAHDDLGLVSDGLLVTDFVGGRIVLLSREGELLQETDQQVFSTPSTARLGQPPMFRSDDILVTEQGSSGVGGNRLTLFRRN